MTNVIQFVDVQKVCHGAYPVGGIDWVAGYRAYDYGNRELSLSAQRDFLWARILGSQTGYDLLAAYLCELGDDFVVPAGAEYSQYRHVTGAFGAGVRF